MPCASETSFLRPHPRPLSQREGGTNPFLFSWGRLGWGQVTESPPLVKGDLGGFPRAGAREIELHVIGIGKERALSSINRLLTSRQWSDQDGILLIGFAGGLDPSLKSGDLVLADRYYLANAGENPPNPPLLKGGLRERPLPKAGLEEAPLPEGPAKPPFRKGGFRGISPLATENHRDFLKPDGNMYQQALEAANAADLSVSQGSSLMVDQVIATPETKKASYHQYQASIVNMEDYWIAEAAAEAGVPFLAVRAVLDPARQGLPSYLIGRSARPAQVIHRTLIRPWRVPTLLRLAQQMKAAQGSLTRFSLAFIDYQLSAREDRSAVSQ
jgi:nucleoside phosphorylase